MKDINKIDSFLWGDNSFAKELEEKLIWNEKKYWELEYYLIDLSKLLSNSDVISKDVSANLYFLGRFIEGSFLASINPNDVWTIKNLNEDELSYYYDRFYYLMRIVFGKVDYKKERYFFLKNPYYPGQNPL